MLDIDGNVWGGEVKTKPKAPAMTGVQVSQSYLSITTHKPTGGRCLSPTSNITQGHVERKCTVHVSSRQRFLFIFNTKLHQHCSNDVPAIKGLEYRKFGLNLRS